MMPDILWNFISPVTGRVLSDPNYVLVGNSAGIAIPSPQLIDIRLDLLSLSRTTSVALTADFVIGNPNSQVPNAQVLSLLPSGVMINTAGTVSSSPTLSLTYMPNLPQGNLWIGNSSNRPIASPTIATSNLPSLTQNYLWIGNSSNVATESLTISINNLPTLNQGSVYLGDPTNRPVIGNPPRGPAGPQGPQGPQGASGSGGFGIAGLAGLAGLAGVAGAAGAIGAKGASGNAGTAGLQGAAGAAGVSTLMISTNYDMLGNRIANIAPNPLGDDDAVAAQWVWNLIQDGVLVNF